MTGAGPPRPARAFSTRPAPVELSRAREHALDEGYWRSLADDLSLGTDLDTPARAPVDDDRIERLTRDGTLSTPGAADAAQVTAARRAVDVVVAAGWPRVFAWMFDEVWRCVRAPGVTQALSSVLGARWRQLPGVWVNHVAPVEGAAGWAPHVDVGGAAQRMGDGAPARLTAWLALTDATIDNGCMFYVPAHATADLAARFESLDSADMNEVTRWLQHARPLPADAGTLLCWRLDVLHWGGVAMPNAAGPRLALAFEAAHQDAPLDVSDGPAFDADAIPSFAQRLSVVGRGLLAYGKSKEREPFAHRFVALGEELCDLWLEER